MTLHPTILATLPDLVFLEVSRTANSMCGAAIVLLVIGVLAVKNDIAQARGIDKVVALANLCFAMPLAVFGAEHFAAAEGISQIVPKFMPWHMFWTYFVGVALIAASLSISTKILVRWSGLLIGIMFLIFVSMMDLPGTLAKPNNRFVWALLCRELSFGAGGLALSAAAINGWGERGRNILITISRLVIGPAAVFYGVEHFLHPLNVPGVPLEMVMPTWIPGPLVIGYLTGAGLIVGGLCILLAKKTYIAAAYLGGWILLIVLLVYGAILIASLLNPSTDVKVEGLNYFFDTLLYAGTILAVASATPRTE
jgi:uncharacterized membrane protein